MRLLGEHGALCRCHALGIFTFGTRATQEYTREEDLDIKFAVKFADLEDPELRNTPSTYLHFAILGDS